jgi:hypothetical protein
VLDKESVRCREGEYGAQRLQSKSSSECGQKAQAEAHIEHSAHGCDAGGVKAQRLVERHRSLPSPRGATDRGKTRGTEMWHTEREGRNTQRARRARGPARECGQKAQAEAQAEAHIEHSAHGCDAGGVKAQQLVESSRTLPSPKGASDRGKRVARKCGTQREGRISSSARGVCAWPTARECGHRRRRQRT